MKEEPKDTPLDALLNLPIGSPASRAAARAAVEQPGRPPNISVHFVSKESVLEGRSDFRRAQWGAEEFVREEGETMEQFAKRVHFSLPLGGTAKLIEWIEK